MWLCACFCGRPSLNRGGFAYALLSWTCCDVSFILCTWANCLELFAVSLQKCDWPSPLYKHTLNTHLTLSMFFYKHIYLCVSGQISGDVVLRTLWPWDEYRRHVKNHGGRTWMNVIDLQCAFTCLHAVLHTTSSYARRRLCHSGHDAHRIQHQNACIMALLLLLPSLMLCI